MDRTSSFPNQDFEGMVSEIWLGLNGCLYHAAYVKVYADTIAMHLAGSRRRHTVPAENSVRILPASLWDANRRSPRWTRFPCWQHIGV